MKRTPSIPAQAATMIRNYLKANNIAGSVKSEIYSMGSSVNVYVTDLEPEVLDKLRTFANQFQYGRFDGMQDLYEYTNSRDDLPQVKYVFVNNTLSPELSQEIWNFARNYYAGMEDAPENQALASKFYNPQMNEYGNTIIWMLFDGKYMRDGYWNFAKGIEEVLEA